jgi:hypothetical protein
MDFVISWHPMKLVVFFVALLSNDSFAHSFSFSSIPILAQPRHALLRSCKLPARPSLSGFRARPIMVAEFGSSFPDILFSAKSGIDILPESTQTAVFTSVFFALGLGTVATTNVVLPALQRFSSKLYEIWIKRIWLVSIFFILSGIGHFAFAEAVCKGERTQSEVIFGC